MPWHIIRQGSQFCVAKQGESAPISGGCHDSEGDAQKHMAALYANVSDAHIKGALFMNEKLAQLFASLVPTDAEGKPLPTAARDAALFANALSAAIEMVSGGAAEAANNIPATLRASAQKLLDTADLVEAALAAPAPVPEEPKE